MLLRRSAEGSSDEKVTAHSTNKRGTSESHWQRYSAPGLPASHMSPSLSPMTLDRFVIDSDGQLHDNG
jgi:hypothetical protein